MGPTSASSAAARTALADAAALQPRDVTLLAQAYRQWRTVLAASVDAVRARGDLVSGHDLVPQLCELLDADGRAPERDIEDAAMGLWLRVVADSVREIDATSQLLLEPWKQFSSQREADPVG